MKQIIENYTFDKTAKTIVLDDLTSVDLKRLYLVTNVTRNKILYNFADDSLGASISGNTITLTNAETEGYADSDKMQIIYDALPTDEIFEADKVTLFEPLAGEDYATNRMMVEGRFVPVVIDSAGTHNIKAIPGFLHRIVATGGPAGTINLFDNANAVGVEIAKYDGANFFNHELNCIFNEGLTVVTSEDTKLTLLIRA